MQNKFIKILKKLLKRSILQLIYKADTNILIECFLVLLFIKYKLRHYIYIFLQIVRLIIFDKNVF